MKHTRLAAAIYREIENEAITLSALSDRIGRTQGAMSLLIARGSRASSETLGALTRCWKNQISGVRIMIAHLHDEVERAGWRPAEYSISYRDNMTPETLTQLDKDLADLRAAAEYVPALACLIADVLAVARAELPAGVLGRTHGGSTGAQIGVAAELPVPYDARKKKE